jgi:DEAD/DEAH box helicase domain-containing protein
MSAFSLHRFADRILATREIPAREPRYAPLPADLHPALRQAVHEFGIQQLYIHQAEAWQAARRGDNVVVTTGTASGKSLTYLLPVVQSVLEDPSARTLLLYPTKALTQDQLRAVVRLVDGLGGHRRIESGVYDGDTPPNERLRIRDKAHLILTNPDMLHTALLPNHGRQGFAHVFRNVRYIVIDELHSYRGAFGAHIANLMRRLLRICKHYGSTPQFLCSSATIANAREHAETLCQRPFTLIDEDGSPSAGKTVHFWQPPLLASGVRKSVTSEMTQLLPWLIQKRHRTITFCRSRKETEIVLKEARDGLRDVAGHDETYLLAGYRGGYTPEERRTVEKSLTDGRLLGVVSTNALELGIDIGQLQVVVQGGFPGTRASFWQQMGRAGRRGEKAHAVLMLALTPEDQFIAEDPDWLTGQPAEHAVVDRDNLAIQLAHVRSAAAELPLTIDDVATFPDLGEIVAVLAKSAELRDVMGTWHWTGGPFPAGEFSLRNIDVDRFKIVNRDTGRTITEMDRPQVYREAHTRAVYLHDGVQYQVEALDLVGHVATVVPVEQNFYTQPDVRTHIDVLLTQEQRRLGRTGAYFGDVAVDDAVVGYKMLEFHNHQNLGYEGLHEPLKLHLETEAVWLAVPEAVLGVLGREKADALAGMVHALHAIARLRTMAERSDLQATSFHHVDDDTGRTVTALICYDSHPGGLGYAAKAYDLLDEVLAQAIQLVEQCRCKRGCPACVGDYVRDKRLIAWALRACRDDVPVPVDLVRREHVTAANDDRPQVERVPWLEVVERWSEVLAALRELGVQGADALSTVREVRQGVDRLTLAVASPGLVTWLSAEETARRLQQGLGRVIAAPQGWRLAVELAAGEQDAALRKAIRLQRRHDDIVVGQPETEREANDRLASGYVLGGGEGEER